MPHPLSGARSRAASCWTALALLLAPAAAGHPRGITTPGDVVAYLRLLSGHHTISGQFVECGDLGPVYDVSRLDAAGLLVPGTPTHAALMRSLQGVAAGLRELQDAGVVVILRPFHESGGDWFWWGTCCLTPTQATALWRFTHDYLANTAGLHNLVWLFESGQPDVPVLANYPGDSYVDLVGQDVYTSTPGADPVVRAYATLVGTGKPVVMAEFGPKGPDGGDRNFSETALVAAFRERMPRTVFFVQWWDQNAGRTGWGMASTQEVGAALSDPWIVNRGDIALPSP